MKKGKVFTVILMGIVMTTGGKMTEFNTEVKADISSEFEIPQADEAAGSARENWLLIDAQRRE